MAENKTVTPLKVGLLIVVASYFLFTLHALFTLQWLGEWNRIGGGNFNFGVFITDISAFPGLIVRFIGSLIALIAVAMYITKGLPQPRTYKLLKAILILEALYWLTLLPSGIWGTFPTRVFNLIFYLSFFLSTGLPCTVASISIPIFLFMVAKNIGANKPQRKAIKWSLIAGIFYVVSFWLNNTGMWLVTAIGKGFEYVLSRPEFIISFAFTVFGLLALAIYTAYFAKKSIGIEKVQDLRFGAIGAILTALGVYYLWNYLAWIFFGGWNDWYAWILGHNLDLWILSLPLVGLPLLFYRKPVKQTTDAENKNA
jgi:hypothetical protein